MGPLLNCAVIAKDIPLRLTMGQMSNPKEALRKIYEDFSLHEMREVLWESFSQSFTNEEEHPYYSRRDLLYYYELIVQVLEAGSLLFDEPKC